MTLTKKQFDELCRTLIKRDGVDLYPSMEERRSRITSVVTPNGKVFIKQTPEGLHVSTPGYKGIWTIYQQPCNPEDTSRCIWRPAEAIKILPFIKRRLILDLLSTI